MPWWIYLCFIVFVTALIFFDLSVLHRRSEVISLKASLAWTAVWVCFALAFDGVIYALYEGLLPINVQALDATSGKKAAFQYLTGYVIEYSLSMDNIFVIAMIMASFRVPAKHQHRLLYWGILGAAFLRGVMILAGAALVAKFEWLMYVFGVMLIVSAGKILVATNEEIHPEGNLLVRLVRRFYPVTPEFHGRQFFVQIDGRWWATPMLLALVLIESCDAMFALDSVPAMFSITRDPFIIFTSNIFAILGLRTLYFALAGLMDRFHHLSTALVFVLVFVGVKMLLHAHFEIREEVSLAIIAGILLVGVVTSLLSRPKHADEQEADPSHVDPEPSQMHRG